ncbi:unnamed protein product [Protopolystoma xenopodis]|uniref:Kinesin light chain 3 n=1 Tax=Protopolystoma xenopodis TaxID=117903 RepID=A0A3S5AIB1_9PLAT|nr:unnamed protein product [Protopolystoma xenopodis]
MTRAHENEFGQISDTNKPIWMLAEERQAGRLPPSVMRDTNNPHHGMWMRATKLDNSTVFTTLKNLAALYRRQGNFDAAGTIEECTSGGGTVRLPSLNLCLN